MGKTIQEIRKLILFQLKRVIGFIPGHFFFSLFQIISKHKFYPEHRIRHHQHTYLDTYKSSILPFPSLHTTSDPVLQNEKV